MRALLLAAILAASGDVNLWLKLSEQVIDGSDLTNLANAITTQYSGATPATVREYTVRRTLDENPSAANPLGVNGCWTYGSYEVTKTHAQFWSDKEAELVRKYLSKTDTHVTYWRKAPEKYCSTAARNAWDTFVKGEFTGIDFYDSVQINCKKPGAGEDVTCHGSYADEVNKATGLTLRDAGSVVKFISISP